MVFFDTNWTKHCLPSRHLNSRNLDFKSKIWFHDQINLTFGSKAQLFLPFVVHKSNACYTNNYYTTYLIQDFPIKVIESVTIIFCLKQNFFLNNKILLQLPLIFLGQTSQTSWSILTVYLDFSQLPNLQTSSSMIQRRFDLGFIKAQ